MRNDTISSYDWFLVAGDRKLRWHVHLIYTGAVQEPFGRLRVEYGPSLRIEITSC